MSARYLSSFIGRKQLMAISGLGWCGFLLAHMVGNLLFFIGPEEYNQYSYNLTSNKEIYYGIELGLLSFFVVHILSAISVILENRRARPIAYARTPSRGTKGAASVASRTMALSGTLILVFVILHLIHFRFGPDYPFSLKGGLEGRDLYRLMVELFAQGGYVAFYVLGLFVLSFHLSHALWSSLQTLGWIPPGKERGLRMLSHAFGILVCAGFALNPIFIYFLRGAK